MARSGRPPAATHRDRLLWLLLPLAAAVVLGMTAVASAFWTGGGAVRPPASVEVGPGGSGSTTSSPPPQVRSTAPSTPGPTPGRAPASSPPPSQPETPTTTAPHAVVAPDHPVVQQTTPEPQDTSGGGSGATEGADG